MTTIPPWGIDSPYENNFVSFHDLACCLSSTETSVPSRGTIIAPVSSSCTADSQRYNHDNPNLRVTYVAYRNAPYLTWFGGLVSSCPHNSTSLPLTNSQVTWK